MTLPNYFLADLPPEATLSGGMIAEACQALKRNREHYLARRSTASLVRVLSEAGTNWLNPDYPFRKMALAQGPAATGFSEATLAAGLEVFFSRLTEEELRALLVQELGHAQRLDEMVANADEQRAQRASWACGPELLVHIAAGNIPSPILMSMVLGLLVRSAQFIKCASGAALLPRLFAHSLYDAEPKLGACLEIAEWRGGQLDLETALFAEAGCVTATGEDESLSSIRQRVPAWVRFIGHGHRISFGYIAHEALGGVNARRVASRAASDVIAWDQQGCLSPHAFYVERGGPVSPERFAEILAEELALCQQSEPRGRLSAEQSAVIAAKRAFYEVRAAHCEHTRQWHSPGSTAWTVIYEADPLFQMSCLNRFIYVKSASGVDEVLRSADAVRGHVSTVGVAAPEEKAQTLALELARWGAARVCPLGQMQNPPLIWRHDGRPSLGELVTWTDWER